MHLLLSKLMKYIGFYTTRRPIKTETKVIKALLWIFNEKLHRVNINVYTTKMTRVDQVLTDTLNF